MGEQVDREWKIVFEFLSIVLLISVGIYFLVKQVLSAEGKATVVWSQHIPWSVQKNRDNQLIFSTIIPVKNETSIDFTLIDVFPRLQLPEEQYKEGVWRSWCRQVESKRTDGYWEAVIVPRTTETAIEIFVVLDSLKTFDTAMMNLPDFSIDLYWLMVCRNPQRVEWSRLIVSADKLREAWQRGEKQ